MGEKDPKEAIAAALRRAGIGRETPCVLAFSGGSDSLGLLALLTGLARARRPAIAAVHVDHGLREASAKEARSAVAAARALGVSCLVVKVTLSGKGGVEARARRARYRALASEAAGRPVFTAHTADDQAETLLLRLARGTGLAGLSGVRERATVEGAHLVRPALSVRRADLRAAARATGISAVEDPTNGLPRFARSRVRATVLPALEAALPGAIAGLARAAELLGADESYLDRRSRRATERLSLASGIDARGLLLLAPAVRGRVVRLLVRAAGGRTPDRAGVHAVLHAAAVEGEAHLPGGILARCRAGVLSIGPGPTGRGHRARGLAGG